ncbi:MAG: site-specific DNA-methyltransferase, partial [Anaerovorax sp.]
MSILIKLPHIIEEGKKQCEAILKTSSAPFHLVEGFQEEDQQDGNQGVIVNGDNLQFMASLLAQGEKLDLIYIDPPFFSKSNYGNAIKVKAKDSEKAQVITQNAYRDTWDGGLEGYLSMLTPRLYLMKALLKDTGTLWVHLDWHASHYVKILLDEIFGEEQFINEVIWNYKSGGASKKRFGRKHDTLLFYGKSKHYYFKPQQEKSYNRGMKPYRFKGVEEFQDRLGWYTMVNMKDVWQIDMVGRTSAERTGYATQKPESLIERILTSCTKEGDVCADFFAGSGTMAAVAQKMNRNW